MKRKLLSNLIQWMQCENKRPILLKGGKGVGKTHLALDFAKTFYSQYIYMNFQNEPHLYHLMEHKEEDLHCKCKDYYHKTNLGNESKTTLVVLDEFNLKSYKEIVDTLLCDKYLDVFIISSNISYVSVQEESFFCLHLHPLDFEEFLTSTGNEWYIDVIIEHYQNNNKIPDIVHQELLTLLEDYLEIGGMPLAVNEYISTESKDNVSEQHRILINSYLSDAYLQNPEGDGLRILQIFKTLDGQLIKENKKFQFTFLRKGATLSTYMDAISYMQNTYYGIPSLKLINDTELNHKDYKSGFTLYMMDIGLLNTIIKSQYNKYNEKIKKAIILNYVAQSLTARGYTINFWESNSKAKLDFVIQKNNDVIPIDVKIGSNTKSKNISIFKANYNINSEAIKISMKNFEYSNQTKYIPIYSIFCI